MARKKVGKATHDFPHGLAQPALRALQGPDIPVLIS